MLDKGESVANPQKNHSLKCIVVNENSYATVVPMASVVIIVCAGAECMIGAAAE